MKFFIITVIVLIILIILLFAYFGVFTKLNIEIKEMGGDTVVYEEIKGDYRQSGEIMDKLYYYLLNEEKITTYKGFGIYYDNPKKVKTQDLRSEAGCILNKSDLDKVEDLKEKYNIKILDKEKYIVTEFPYKNKISVIFSIMKVYPALIKYARENNYKEDSPVTEIYNVTNNKIIYLKKIIK